MKNKNCTSVKPTCDSLQGIVAVGDELLAQEAGGVGPQTVTNHVQMLQTLYTRYCVTIDA